jgi:sec-independent protein translocase protein TatB
MFEIGFFELLICALVALVVLGPERLPEALRFVGRIFAKFNRVWQRLSSDVSSKIHD